MSEIHQTDVDGVRTFWRPLDGPLTATLSFRVGTVDEPLPKRGVTHLVEHLALFRVSLDGPGRVNGGVGALSTDLVTQGQPHQVAGFLAGVCRSLHDLPFERLPAERHILGAEAGLRDPGILTLLLRERFGATGHGRATYPEYGLDQLTEDDVRAWAARYCTAANAVLTLTGPPPDGLTLPLPAGPPEPIPPTRDFVADGPAWVGNPDNGSALLTVVPHSPASAALTAVAWQRLHRMLRLEAPASLSPTIRRSRLDAAQDLIVGAAAPARMYEIVTRNGLVELFEGIARDGAGAALEEWQDEIAGSAADPDCLRQELLAHADTALLTGRPPAGTTAQRAAGVTAEAVTQLAAEAAARALFVVPDRFPLARRDIGRVRDRADRNCGEELSGSEHRPVSQASWNAPFRLIRSDDGLALQDDRVASRGQVVVRADDCAAVLHGQHGERELIGNDGQHLHVGPQHWRGGDEVVRHVERIFPPELTVRLPEPTIRAEAQTVRRWPREPWGAWSVFLAAVVVWPFLGWFAFWLLVLQLRVPFRIWLFGLVVFGWVRVLEEIGEWVQQARAARGLVGLGRLSDVVAPFRAARRLLRRRPGRVTS